MTNERNLKLISKLLFRLLPLQILLAMIGAVNGIVSGLFASNFIGEQAVSVVELYAPVTQFLGAVNLMLVGGSQILCGQFMGRNEKKRASGLFSLDMLIAGIIALVIMILLLGGSLLDLTRLFVKDDQVRMMFNHYILGQTVGLIPLMLGQQTAAFLSLENRVRRTTIASVAFILVNLALTYLFVVILKYGVFGLALASSLGLWVFFLIQLPAFTGHSGLLRFNFKDCRRRDVGQIIRIGIPSSFSQGYQTIRRLIVNGLVMMYVGSVGLSAFGAADMLLTLVWAIPSGMLAVSRMMMSISIGEEDRRTLTDIMRVMFRRFVPLMCAIDLAICACAVPLTRLFYQDPSAPVFDMTVWGFRILPWCMPFSVVLMHFICYGQESGKTGLVHVLSLVDGVLSVAAFSALLVPRIGINGVYTANVLNGVVTTLIIAGYALIKNKALPKNTEELMVIPDSFGVPDEQRMDLSLTTADEVVSVSQSVQSFCEGQGIDRRRALLSGLCMEEMAGNVVEHGFVKDRKKHTVDVGVVHIGENVVLRIRDDCLHFDPIERLSQFDRPEDNDAANGDPSAGDPFKNVGIRIVHAMADDVTYQSILGLNVLTIRM